MSQQSAYSLSPLYFCYRFWSEFCSEFAYLLVDSWHFAESAKLRQP